MPLHPEIPSPLDSLKFRLVLPFWYRLTQVVLEKRLLNWRSSTYCLFFSIGKYFRHIHVLYCLLFAMNECLSGYEQLLRWSESLVLQVRKLVMNNV